MGRKTNIATAIIGATPLGSAGIATATTSASGAPTTAAPATAALATAAGPNCQGNHDDGWSVRVDGRPSGADAGDHGVYLWHDQEGWHVRITHANDAAKLYTGEVVTDGTLTAQPVKVEKDDTLKIGPHDHALTFAFANYGGIDGIDFQTSCAQYLHFNFRADGHEVSSAQVHVGEDGHHPAHVPFTVVRHR